MDFIENAGINADFDLHGGESSFGAVFDYMELDDDNVKIVKGEGNYVRCESCGALNPRGNNYCAACQSEIILFRSLDLDVKPVKVVLKFQHDDNCVYCPVCGGANVVGATFCKDCTSPLTDKVIERESQKVKFKHKKSDKYVYCPVCGAVNVKENKYCQDCAKLLPGIEADEETQAG